MVPGERGDHTAASPLDPPLPKVLAIMLLHKQEGNLSTTLGSHQFPPINARQRVTVSRLGAWEEQLPLSLQFCAALYPVCDRDL